MADAYWRERLAGIEATTFPDLTGVSAAARRSLTDFNNIERTLQIDEFVNRPLTTSSCLAASAKVLALYLGETDFCIDYEPEIDQFPGPCPTDTALLLRVAFETSSTNEGVVSQIEDNLTKAIQYGSPSLELLQEFIDAPGVSASDILVTIRGPSPAGSSDMVRTCRKYALIIDFIEEDGKNKKSSYIIKLHHRSSCILSSDAPHILSALEEAFFSVSNDPQANFLSWRLESSLQQSTCNWDAKAIDSSDAYTVQAAFEKHAVQRPDDIALDFLEEDFSRTKWTFSTLNSIANRIAHKLVQDYHVQAEDSVPICVDKSPAFYACILGVLKAGGCFTPFAGSPPERRKFMLDELGSQVLLCTEGQDMSWSSGVEIFNITPLVSNRDDNESSRDSEGKAYALSSTLCYHMYTSGSTGRPKAVSLEHRNAVQTVCATRELVPWTSNSRILQQAGVTFDMCYFETFFAWIVGICLCSAPDDLIYNQLPEVINDMDVSLLGLTPSVALTLDPDKLPGIEWMYCIGEALPQSLVDAWEGRLVNSYGPTEAAQMVTLFPVNREVKSTVIGKPFKNTSFTVLRKDYTETIPILGVGELCIGGSQIARGYYKNHEKTGQSFIDVGGHRLYRTGDLVRMLGNGTFEFLGRVDDQVKIRGHRVELGEIDKALEGVHHAIERACTQVLKVSDKSKGQLVAFLVLNDSATENDKDELLSTIDACLSDVLPAYMNPKLYLFVDRIPLSLAGKVDKRALTQRLRESNKVQANELLQTAGSSRTIIQLLQQVYGEFCGLSSKEIDPNTSIYQLGIDSISAIQISHRLKDKGFRIQANDVLNYPTISQLGDLLQENASLPSPCKELDQKFDYDEFDLQYRSEVAEQCAVSSTTIAMIRPASPLQTSMISQSAQSFGSLYFNHLSFSFPDQLDLPRFLDAWEALVSKHEILRSGFTSLDNSQFPVAIITYHARSLPSSVRRLTEDDPDIDELNTCFTKIAVKQMYLPPWQVLVSEEQGKFFLSAHHALYDAQVLDLLIRDLAIVYDGGLLPKYLAFDTHLAKLLNGCIPKKSTIHFWEDYGKSATSTVFPLLHPLLENPSGLEVITACSPLPLPDIEKYCRASGVTLQAAAQAAWGYLLGAITGEDIITFGTVLSGRLLEGSNEISFPLITTVPTVVNRSTTFVNIVRDLMRHNADVQLHQFVPLRKIQKLMGFAGEAFFNTIFTFQKRSYQTAQTKTKFEFLENTLTIEYPISVELEPTENGELKFSIFYQSNYMLPEQASLIVDQFHFFLRNIITGGVSAVAPAIQDADCRLFSITPPEYAFLSSKHTLLHHTVEITARDNPDNVALEFITSLEGSEPEKDCWTFREIDEEGNRIANFLHAIGVSQGSIVAMCFDKCPEAAFAMLGILKSGCSFLALDPGAPTERKRFIIQDSQASVLLTKDPLAASLRSSLGDAVIDLDQHDLTKYASSPVRLARAIDPQENSYCLYTSGTTGTPKGCEITHENVIQVFLCFEKLYAHTDESRWLQFASYHFDVSVMEHFWSWFVGMTVVKASRDLVLQDLPGTISTLQISHIDLTPSLARLLDPKDVPTLAQGVFVTGGEMLRKDIIDAWGESGAIHNAYGPTEATIGVTMYRRVPKNGRPSIIGRPFPVVGIFVVNPSNPTLPVLRGGVGELVVAGKLVAKGYLRRQELTSQRFITLAGQKCYRTGDLVRVLSDGSIEFLGRADDQVKLRGQRLEIGEINHVIKQRNDSIDDVTTLVLKHPKQQKEQLVSFVALRGGTKHKEELFLQQTQQAREMILQLRAACIEKLPGYMVPTHILLVNKMPLSSNNKIEAKQLKALYENIDLNVLQNLINVGDVDMLDRTYGEDIENISQILSKSIGIDAAGVCPSSSFFELGLDSISVIDFSRSLKAKGYKQANPSLIMRNSTVSSFVAVITSQKSQSRDGLVQSARKGISAYSQRFRTLAASIFEPENIEIIVPCTALQAGIISRSLESHRGLYFSAFSFDLDNSIDLARLQDACKTACNSIQILRTKFMLTDDGYVSVMLHSIDTPLTEHTVDRGDQVSQSLKAAHHHWWKDNQHHILRPFELLVTKTPTRTIFTLHIFHALYDGNSLPLIMTAVTSEYHGQTITYGPAFSEALPYGPLREDADAESFWTNHLSSLENVLLVELNPLSKVDNRMDTCVTHRIDPIRGMEAFRRKLNVTHQAVVQACWTTLLQDIMAGPIVIGMIVSGRSIDFEGADKVIGPLFNTIPFLLTLSEHDTWKDIIIRCHEFNVAALIHQHTPLRNIKKWTRKFRTSRSLFDTLFVFQKQSKQDDAMKLLGRFHEETFETDYPLAFEAEQTLDGGFNLTLACQAYMSDNKTSRTLLHRFEHLLASMIDNPESNLSEALTNDVFVRQRQRTLDTNDHTKGSKSRHTNGHTNKYIHTHGNSVIPKSNSNEDAMKVSETCSRVCEEIAVLASTDPIEVNAGTSIFEVGLDSIDAVKLSCRLKKATGVLLPVSQIMQLLTTSKIAAAIDDKGEGDQRDTHGYDLDRVSRSLEQHLTDLGVDMSGVEKVLPCTPLQEAIMADILNSDFERYLNSDILKLKEDTDFNKLKYAWVDVVNALPILRSRFVDVTDPQIDCTIAQVVMKPQPFKFGKFEITAEDQFSEILTDIREEIRRNFNDRPPLRLTFVESTEPEKSNYLVLTLPHVMYDGWSLGLIHESVNKAYRGTLLEPPSYERVLANILNSSGRSSQKFWRQALTGLQVTLFPARNERNRAIHRVQHQSQVSLRDIFTFCKQAHVTIAALCQMVWSIALVYYTKQLDVSFAQVLSGRMDENTDGVIFPTMNTVISRIVLHGNRLEMVQYMQEHLSAILEHQHFPLRKALAFAARGKSKDIFNTLFIFQKSASEATDSRPQLYESIYGTSNVEYPVCVEAEVAGQQLVWRTACEETYLNAQQTREMLHIIDRVLGNIISDPAAPVIDFNGDKMRICNLPTIDAPTKQDGIVDEKSTDSVVSEEDSSWSEIEQEIREVIASVAKLNISEINKQSSLLGLGLDSISTIKVSSLLRKRGLKFSVNDILSAASIQKIAMLRNDQANNSHALPRRQHVHNGLVESHKNKTSSREQLGDLEISGLLATNEIEPQAVEQVLPVSAGQMLLLSRWQNEGIYYSLLDFSVRNCKDVERLRAAWSALIARSPILRTIFIATGKRRVPVVQAILKSVEAQFVLVPSDSCLEQEAARIRDTRSGPPTSPCALFAQQVSSDYFELGLKISHALYDGFSIKALISMFQDLVNDPSIQTPHHSFMFSTYLASTAPSDSKRQFWTNYLSDVKFRQLPLADSSDDQVTVRQNHVIKADVIRNLPSLRQYARNHQVSFQSLLLASYAITHALSLRPTRPPAHDVDDILIGIFMANRNLEDADGLAAPTLSFAPVRVTQPLGRSTVSIAQSIQDDIRSISKNGRSQIRLWELQDWLGKHIKIDVWVNILRQWLPDTADDTSNKVRIITGEKSQNLERQYEVRRFDEDASHGLLLKNNVVRDCYDYRMMDLEVTVKDDNVDISIQARSTLVSIGRARQIIAEVGERLDGLVDGGDDI